MQAAEDSSQEVAYTGYIVAVLDVLGQREAIRNLAKLQPLACDRSHVIRALKDSLGVRDEVREKVKLLFERSVPVAEDPRFDDAQREVARRLHHRGLRTYAFGDTVIAYAPLVTPQRDPSISDIHRMLSACACPMLGSLADGTALRGGIELGFGLEPEHKEVYGPAFLSAYELEQNIAQYPRIVVGPELARYLQTLCAHRRASALGPFLMPLAERCLRLIARDDDGCFLLDYLGEGLRTAANAEEDAHLFDKGLEFARREHERFIAEGNPKLAGRYAAVVRYYNAHASGWRKSG